MTSLIYNKKYFKNLKHGDKGQYKKTYFSTLAVTEFLKKKKILSNSKSILEIGCGIGSVLNYLSQKNKSILFTGGDYRMDLLKHARKLNQNINNITFTYLNWNKINKKFKNKFDGIISIKSLCCMTELKKPIEGIIKLNPKWFFINSLFCEEELDVFIRIKDFKKYKEKEGNEGDFNIFSLSTLKKILKKKGYSMEYIKFNLKKKIKKKNNNRGTFTMKTEISNYTQFSGPVYLPWFFVLCKKIKK